MLPPAAGAAAPKVRWVPASTNFTRADRPPSSIRWIVIHTTEGGFAGSVSWLRNPRARASAHYVVSQRGEIAQLVRDSDIAWHAGNYLINRSSIGIEHEGWAYRPGTITDVEYRRSAELSAWLARRSLMPIDRKHFIGHADVPDPNNPGKKGGFSHHMDPGPHWSWPRYLGYVRSYARGAQPPRYAGAKPAQPKQAPLRAGPVKVAPVSKQTVGTLKIASLGFASGQRVSGYVRWPVSASGPKVQRVDFLVDGRVRASDTKAPFAFGGDDGRWDTTRETNGAHVLGVRVVSAGGKVAGASVRVQVVNTPFQVVSQVQTGTTLAGSARWRAGTVGGTADRVEFLVDGRLRQTDESAPFEWDWDTKKEANGPHALTLRGIAEDGRVATTTVGVTVVNEAPPPPKPVPFEIRSQSLRDGDTVRGAVRWEVATSGVGIATVEFWIDGVLRWTETGRPYRFNGDSGRWDTAQETPGPHQLAVRVVHRDGRSTGAGLTVTVAAGSGPGGGEGRAPTLRVATASLNPGQTVSGTVRWDAEGDGLARVDYYVDGRHRRTVTSAPWTYEWDTRPFANGEHTLALRATGTDGKRTELRPFTVVVANAAEPLRASLAGVADGASLRGSVRVEAKVEGKVEKVEFLVDGAVRHTERSAPYEFAWDTARERDGAHTLTARAVAPDGRVATASASVLAANAPAPKVTFAAPAAPVSGTVRLEAKVEGTVDRVEFLVDGRLRHTERSAPYELTWDTRAEADGAHSVVARAVPSQGAAVEARAEVTVRNALSVALSGAPAGGTVRGEVSLEARVTGSAAKVEFLVDGAVRRTDTSAPYTFAWDTASGADGAHTVVARAVAAGGRTATAELALRVENGSESLEVTLAAPASPLRGVVHVEARPTAAVARVEFLVDGKLRHTEQGAPYEFDWDTTAEIDGAHVLVARAVAADGRTATAQSTLTVANAAPADPVVVLEGLADGATVTGTVSFEARVDGVPLRRVELWVDGRRRLVEREAPYTFAWNTSAERTGERTVVVRAVTSSGRTVAAKLTITVARA